MGVSSYKHTMGNWYDSIDRGDIMIKKIKKRLKANTQDIKYKSLEEDYWKLAGEMIVMQRKIIHLQDINIKQKEELLEYKNKEIKKLKEKNKRSDK